MADAMYPSFKAAMWAATYDITTGTINSDLIDTGTYTYNSAHNFYDDVTGSVKTSALASITNTNGVYDAANTTHSSVTGATVEAIILWKDTAGASSTDPLICYIDSIAQVTPNGGDIVIQWDAAGIMSL